MGRKTTIASLLWFINTCDFSLWKYTLLTGVKKGPFNSTNIFTINVYDAKRFVILPPLPIQFNPFYVKCFLVKGGIFSIFMPVLYSRKKLVFMSFLFEKNVFYTNRYPRFSIYEKDISMFHEK